VCDLVQAISFKDKGVGVVDRSVKIEEEIEMKSAREKIE